MRPNRRAWTPKQRASPARASRRQDRERKLPCGHHWSGDECDSPCFRRDTLPPFPRGGKNLKRRQEAWLDAEDPEAAMLGRRLGGRRRPRLIVKLPSKRAARKLAHALSREPWMGGPPRKHKPWHLTRKGKRAMRRNGPDDRRFGLIPGEGAGGGIPRGWGKPIEAPPGYVMSDAERQMRESLFDPYMELIPPKSDRFGRIPREPGEYEQNGRRRGRTNEIVQSRTRVAPGVVLERVKVGRWYELRLRKKGKRGMIMFEDTKSGRRKLALELSDIKRRRR